MKRSNLRNLLLSEQKHCTVGGKPVTDEWVKNVTGISSSTFNRLKKDDAHPLESYHRWAQFYRYTDQGRDCGQLAAFARHFMEAVAACYEKEWGEALARHAAEMMQLLQRIEADRRLLLQLPPDHPDRERLMHSIRQHEWHYAKYLEAIHSKL